MTMFARKRRMPLVEWNQDHANFIGRGSFGSVYRGKLRPSPRPIPHCAAGALVAVKVSNEAITAFDIQRSFMGELETLCKVNHPCCVYLVAWDYLPGRPAAPPDPGVPAQCIFVTEYLETDLGKVMTSVSKGQAPPGFDATKKSCIAFGVAFGMAYLHAENMVHRDLKPENILLDANFTPRIADFGLAKLISLENALKMTTSLGTPAYMAPELDDEAYENDDIYGAIDVFSFGMILWELASEKRPFEKLKSPVSVRMAIHDNRFPAQPTGITDDFWTLIETCWSPVPEDRPRFDEIVNTPQRLLFPGAHAETYFDFAWDLVQKYKVE
jgi:serine/threonine protein kinase